MKIKEIQRDIRALLKERNALMLAHNYQRDEIQEVADFAGDSLALSQLAEKSDKRAIIFCGVHFMAESAAILAPEKTVILPRMDAGCPMADMITADQLREEKEKRPGVPVVAYVNTTAEVKAESDICCTSANAVRVVESVEGDSVYMVPDKNLAHYISRSVKNKKTEWWDGYCPTHENLTPEDILEAKAKHPDAPFICHPECRPEVVDMAEHVCSTSGMYKYAKESKAKTIIVGTEMGIQWRLKNENPEKEFIIPSKCLICPNMKVITITDVLESLEKMDNVVSVEESVRVKAKASLDRMLAIPREN